jgi:hypothetical protein
MRRKKFAPIGIRGGGIAPIGGLVRESPATLANLEPRLIRAFDELILTLLCCDAVLRLVRTQSDRLSTVIMGRIYRLLVALEPRSLK